MRYTGKLLLEDESIAKYASLPDGWRYVEGALTAPNGWRWASNGKSKFSGGYQHALIRDRPILDRSGSGFDPVPGWEFDGGGWKPVRVPSEIG